MRYGFTAWIAALIYATSFVAAAPPTSGTPFAAREQRARKAIESLEAALIGCTNVEQRSTIGAEIAEIRASAENNRPPPTPAHIAALLLPVTHSRYSSARVGLGSKPAANLERLPATRVKLDSIDPLPSSFW